MNAFVKTLVLIKALSWLVNITAYAIYTITGNFNSDTFSFGQAYVSSIMHLYKMVNGKTLSELQFCDQKSLVNESPAEYS